MFKNNMGRRRVSSIYKIRIIRVITKNRMEKGVREEFRGSNQHSNGEPFSRSRVFLLRRTPRVSIIKTSIKIINQIKM